MLCCVLQCCVVLVLILEFLSLPLFSLFFFFFFLPVRFHKGSGSHVHFCPRPCSSTHRMGQALHPPTPWTTHCAICALVPLSRVTNACVSSPRDWAVSIGSHVQLDRVISLAPSRLGAPLFHLFKTVDKETRKKAIICPQAWPSSDPVVTRVLRPAGCHFLGTFMFSQHAFHFGFIRASRHWGRSACRSNYDSASANLSVLGATSAAQRSGEKASLSQRKSHCQKLPFENTFQVSCTTQMTPAQGLPSQPSPNCCSTSLVGENANRINYPQVPQTSHSPEYRRPSA